MAENYWENVNNFRAAYYSFVNKNIYVSEVVNKYMDALTVSDSTNKISSHLKIQLW